jgi:hypothetical protein
LSWQRDDTDLLAGRAMFKLASNTGLDTSLGVHPEKSGNQQRKETAVTPRGNTPGTDIGDACEN